VISEADANLLDTGGVRHVSVIELEQGEIGEDVAVMQVAREIGCGSLEIRPTVGGRANLFTSEPCCLLVDPDLLTLINCMAGIVIATSKNFSYARRGQRVASVKSTPFAVLEHELEAITFMIKERGPLLQARPIHNPAVAILYSDPINGMRARVLFEEILMKRLGQVGARVDYVLSSVEEEGAITRSLHHLLDTQPTALLIASTTAPADANDVIGRSLVQLGCQIERFLAPVEPGYLFLLGYKNDVPIVSAPGCFRSAKPNVVDVMLPPMLARYHVSWREVACLGHGGLLA
jgi:molybdenum cofactor cytidylyltransferase